MLSFASAPLLTRHPHGFTRPVLLPSRPPHLRSPRASTTVTRASSSSSSPPPLIIGLNQYSHDTSLAIIHATTGSLLFALSKERLTRRKHDAGDVALLMRTALTSLACDLSLPVHDIARQITLVVANNHHFRIAPFEKRLPLQVALRYVPPSALSPWNLVGTDRGRAIAPNARKIEMSHHLAHAYSAVYGAPFHSGLVLVMDGMGDKRDDWLRAQALDEAGHYVEERVCDTADDFREFPTDVRERNGVSFREAESVYRFRKEDGQITLERVFKRWTPENEPPELPNHSFEEMDSVGAVYSRISAIIFGDWNACGKVMGLAPYAAKRLASKRKLGDRFFMQGDLFDGSLCMKEGKLKGVDHVGKSWNDTETSPELREYFEDLAYHVQKDLEDVVVTFTTKLQEATGEQNLVFTGGVALNSTLNGILVSRRVFKNVHVPPYPGDEGIAIGCAAFGFYSDLTAGGKRCPLHRHQISPYLGIRYSQNDIQTALQCFSPWITWREGDIAKETAQALARSKIVAWFSGNCEFGPRALGSRSILADPRVGTVVEYINREVKKRESFRPFAPTVLAEHAHEWFEDCIGDSSPFMSITKQCTSPVVVKSVVHVDGTSRLQTVTKDANPEYHQMIVHFRGLTGIPMVLNTSFNVAGEPIVGSPNDALRTFFATNGIDILVFPIPGVVVEKRMLKLLETDIVSSACASFLSHQTQDSFGSSLRTKITYVPRNFHDREEDIMTENNVELIDGLQLEILEFVHEQGACSVQEIIRELLSFNTGGRENKDTVDDSDIPAKEDVLSRLINLAEKRLIFKQQ